MKPYVVGFIFARGGSKGVPRKNLRPLRGKPLIAWAIEAAQGSSLIDRVVVSTEDAEIAEVARDWGAEVPFLRPAELSRDESPELLAWQHAIQQLESSEGARPIDLFVSVPATAPLRDVADIDACIQLLLRGREEEPPTDIVLTVTEANRNPYFNMVQIDSQGLAHLVLEPPDQIHRRQEAPPTYDVTTVAYAASPAFVRSARNIFQGRVRVVVVPRERGLDIDTELDFRIAESLLGQAPLAPAPLPRHSPPV